MQTQHFAKLRISCGGIGREGLCDWDFGLESDLLKGERTGFIVLFVDPRLRVEISGVIILRSFSLFHVLEGFLE